jgi:D-alanine transaminase
MPELANVNSLFIPLPEARVSIEDRGFQFGDGIYEVIIAYDGRPFLLDQHMRRLRGSASAVGLDYDFDKAPLEPVIAEGLRQSDISGDVLIYVQLTRGVGSRAHVPPEGIEPTLVMTFRSAPRIPHELRLRGARLITVPETRWARCYIKAITLLPNALARNAALRRGYDDAIFVTAAGEVRECSASNLFIVDSGGIKIPPRTESILHGVTQYFLMECAAGIGLSVTEEAFDVETLLRADEVFMSSTTLEALGVTSVDDQPIGDGRVGPTTRRLCEEFKKRAKAMLGLQE